MRKRSSYRPRPVMSDPLSLLRPVRREECDRVMRRFFTALHEIAAGRYPGEAEWRDLSDAINTVETLALHLHKLEPAEVMPTVNAAIAAMVGAAHRFKAGQGMRVDGPGLEALRDVLAIYEQCAEGLTEREMCMAQAETQRRMNELLRSRSADPQVIAL